MKNHYISLWVPLHYLYYHYVCLLRCRHYPEGSLFIYFCLKKKKKQYDQSERLVFLRDFPYQSTLKLSCYWVCLYDH